MANLIDKRVRWPIRTAQGVLVGDIIVDILCKDGCYDEAGAAFIDCARVTAENLMAEKEAEESVA